MRRNLPTFALAMLIAMTPAPGAPLCKDNKGISTPCTPHELERVRQHKAEVKVKRQELVAEHPGRASRPPLFAIGKLCRDSKGISTPCPR